MDFVFVQKDPDGNTRTVELNDLDEESYRIFVPLGKHIESLFTEDDLEEVAKALPNNSSAALMLWENLWVRNLNKAVENSEGRLIQRGQIPAEAVQQVRHELAAEAA